MPILFHPALFKKRASSNSVLHFPVVRRTVRGRIVFTATSQIVARVYYPACVRSSGLGEVFALSQRQHAEAVYENVIRFLEDVIPKI